jgi:hypothetical protein
MKSVLAIVLLFASLSAVAQPAKSKSSIKKHALAKVAYVVTAPVAHPLKSLKATFGTIVFATENVVDVAHLGLAAADRAFDALSIQGKVPVLDSIYGFVSAANTDSGKLDTWLEKQEMYLFGTSN